MKGRFEFEYEPWTKRDLSDLELVYWADNLCVKAGFADHKHRGVAVCLSPGSHGCGSSLPASRWAQVIIWKILLVAEPVWRRLNAPEALPPVVSGVPFKDGRMRWTGSVTRDGNDQSERTAA